jgi:hypothetical protein
MLLGGFGANTDLPPIVFCNEFLLGSKYNGATETLSEHESAVLFSGQFVPMLRIKSVLSSSELANTCLNLGSERIERQKTRIRVGNGFCSFDNDSGVLRFNSGSFCEG